MELRDRLATLRRDRGYSLRQLREQIEARTGEKVAVSYLSSLERVEGTPSVEALTRIAAGYDMSLQELLEPVDFSGEGVALQLPPGLQEFRDRHPDVTPEQVIALSRIEYRGARPETAAEWEQIYGMLEVLLGGKVKDTE